MSWFGNVSTRQRRTYIILISVIALTLPCYCIGLTALALEPRIRVSRSPATPTLAPPNIPFIAAVTLPPAATLRLAPTEWVLHTLMPTPVSSATNTNTPTSSATNTSAPTPSATNTSTSTPSPTVSITTTTPTPSQSPTLEPTRISAPTATSLPDVYTLLIAKRGEDSLFVVNESARAFPLEPLRLGDGDGAINGRDWGIGTLGPVECVTARKDGGNPQPPNISCVQVGERLTRDGPGRFWKDDFNVYYSGELIGACQSERCSFNVAVQP